MSQDSHPTQVVIIERIAPGGDGMGRLSNGEWVFVRGAAAGDQLAIKNITRRKGVSRGDIDRIVRAGPDRIEPSCPIATRCGGCDLMQLSASGQSKAKLGILKDALRRIGGGALEFPKLRYLNVGDGFSYRSRLRHHVDDAGNLGFSSARSKSIVPVPRCEVAEPSLNTALLHLNSSANEYRRLLQLCDQIELRAAEQEPMLVARLFPKSGLQLQPSKFQPLFPRNARILVAGSVDDDHTIQSYELANNVVISVPASAFLQVHRGINSILVTNVVQAATSRGLQSFVDTYAGAGNFTLPLLAAGLIGESIDCAAAGILAARSVARDCRLPFAGFNVGDAREQLEALVRNRRQFDLVLLDPPRAGAKDVLSLALQLRPRLVAIVACDPVTLARDLKTLLSGGGRLEELTIYDMFPQTHHMETLALVAI